jgi:hypothetical protein
MLRRTVRGLLVIGLFLCPLVIQVAASADEIGPRCAGQPVVGSSVPEGQTKGDTPFEPANGTPSSLEFHFGQGRAEKELNIPYRTPAGVAVAPASVSIELQDDVLRSDKQPVVPGRQIFFSVSRLGTDKLRVSMCIDPLLPFQVAQGEYHGSVVITAPGVADTTLSLTVFLQYANSKVVFLYVVIAAAIGLFLKAFTDVSNLVQAAPTEAKPAPPAKSFSANLLAYLKEGSSWVWIGFGIVAAVGAWYVTFGQNPSFGGDLKDWGALFVAVVAAGVSGATGPQALAAVGVIRSRAFGTQEEPAPEHVGGT